MMGQAMTEREIEAVLREVTDEEVAFYQEYGWVMMKQLVAPEFTSEFLRLGQEWNLKQQDRERRRNSTAGLAIEGIEPFRSFMLSERMAQNATRLVDRKRLKGVDVPLRYRTDIVILRVPERPAVPITRTRPSTDPIESVSFSSGWRWRK